MLPLRLKPGRLGRFCRRRLRVGAVAALLGLYLWALPFQAAGGDIRVISEQQETDFPGGMVFELVAEGDQDIVEVQLNYRIRHSETWAYAYMNFRPGLRVNASLDLPSSSVGYLPPGVELEYFYSIRDALGNIHQTPQAVFEYLDNRFQWQRSRTGSLTLLHHDVPRSKMAAVVREVDDELRRLASLLQIDLDQPIKGVLYNLRAEAEAAFPFQNRTITDEQVFHGFAFPARGVFVGVGLQTGLIVHESAHLLLHQALGPAAHSPPAWLDEGFASYVEPGSTTYSGHSLRSRGLPLRAMSSVPGNPSAIRTFYQKAESVVAYLIDQRGVESFQRFLAELRRGNTSDQALLSTYGFDVNGLEQHWASSSAGPPAPAPGSPGRPSPIVYFDTWIIGGLVLVVMAVFLVRYIVGKLSPATDPEEGLQPWEDPDLWDVYDDDDYGDGDADAGRPG